MINDGKYPLRMINFKDTTINVLLPIAETIPARDTPDIIQLADNFAIE